MQQGGTHATESYEHRREHGQNKKTHVPSNVRQPSSYNSSHRAACMVGLRPGSGLSCDGPFKTLEQQGTVMDSDDECPPDLVPAVGQLESVTTSQASSRVIPPADAAAGSTAQQTEEGEAKPKAIGAVPVTIVTGFLGAGKTTLLNYILTQDHGRRIAVIENEVGDSMDIEALIAKVRMCYFSAGRLEIALLVL